MSTTLEPPTFAPGHEPWRLEIDVDLDRLVLDLALQCRAGLNATTVADYVELLKNGGRFDRPVRAVRVDGALLVVDGWHRIAATREAFRGSPAIDVEIVDGDRRRAQLEAVSANRAHGLQRSQLDKRRAVRLLLVDGLWCRDSARQLAELAGVSHTYVSKLREEYAVAVGEPLSVERIEVVDGEPPPAWRELLEGATYQTEALKALRIATSPRQLVKAWAKGNLYGDRAQKAFKLRQEELATLAWPWPADAGTEKLRQRAAALDDRDAIEGAVLARHCPDRATLYEVLLELPKLKSKNHWDLTPLVTAWANRPALRRAAEERLAELGAQGPNQAHALAKAIHDEADPDAQAALVTAATDEVLAYVQIARLQPSVRDGAYRQRVGSAGECPDPRCAGWVLIGSSCVACRKWPTHWRGAYTTTMRTTAQLIQAGYAIRIGDVVIDAKAVELLSELQRAAAEGQLGAAPLRGMLREYTARPAPAVIVDAIEPPAADDDDERDEQDDLEDPENESQDLDGDPE